MNRFPFVLGLGALVAVACAACAGDAPQKQGGLAKWAGQYGGGAAAAQRVVRTTEEWDRTWRQLDRERPRALEPGKEMAVFIAMGERRTGGFVVEVQGTRVHERKLIVEYRESAPAPGMMVTQALTSPWVIAIIPRSDLPVVFQSTAPARPGAQER